MSLVRCVPDSKDESARFWLSGEVPYLKPNIRIKLTGSEPDFQALLDFVSSFAGKGTIGAVDMGGLKVFMAEDLPMTHQPGAVQFFSLEQNLAKQRVLLSPMEQKRNSGFFNPLDTLVTRMNEWAVEFKNQIQENIFANLVKIADNLQKVKNSLNLSATRTITDLEKQNWITLFNSEVAVLEEPLRTMFMIACELFFNPFLNQYHFQKAVLDGNLKFSQFSDIFAKLSADRYANAGLFFDKNVQKIEKLDQDVAQIAPFRSYVGFAFEEYIKASISAQSITSKTSIVGQVSADVDNLVKKNLLELGIFSIQINSTMSTKQSDTYELLLLPNFLAKHWQDYFKSQVLGVSLQSIYMSNAVTPLKTLLKRPEDYINPTSQQMKYTQAIMYLKYLKQTAEILDSFYSKDSATRQAILSAKLAPSGTTPSDKRFEFYKNLSKYSYYQMLESKPGTDISTKNPEKLPIYEAVDSMIPKSSEITILKKKASAALTAATTGGQTSTTGGPGVPSDIYAERIPFWVDAARSNKWGAVVIDSRECPFRKESTTAGDFLAQNVAYQMGKLILTHYRESCPTRLSQTSVMYRADAMRLKSKNALALYATGMEEAENDDEEVGGKIEYPTHDSDGAVKNARQSGLMRVLYCVPAGSLPPGFGGLNISSRYQDKIIKENPMFKMSEELPEQVLKSWKCIKEKCTVDFKGVARGPLVQSRFEVASPRLNGVDVDLLNEKELAPTLISLGIEITPQDSINTMRQKLKDILYKQNSPVMSSKIMV
jgi:hypothetical protein